MNAVLVEAKGNSFRESESIYKKVELNYTRNKKQDHTALLDAAAAAFDYRACRHEYWNPEELSLLWGTPLWDGATADQRIVLNHMFWVAYYSQIISAEIATIWYNQVGAAGLYALEDFRVVCDMLDLETAQERAHIHAFRTVSDAVEAELFGERVFSYRMRGPFTETMVHADTDRFRSWWKTLQLKLFGLIASDNAFLACQYFTVRGLRTLNGKMIQHRLSTWTQKHPDKDNAPVPSKISYYHFMDESFHFNSSTLLAHEVVRCLPPPTWFESTVANLGLRGCQKDHFHMSITVPGIFWYDPACFEPVYRMLRSKVFAMGHEEALEMIRACFTRESEGLDRAVKIHEEAVASYRVYLEKVDYAWKSNKDMTLMARSTLPGWLEAGRREFERFAPRRDPRAG